MSERTNIIPYNYLFAIFVMAVFSSCVSSRYRVGKVALAKHFQTNPVFNESHSALMVYDPEKGNVLFDYNGYKRFTPASNTKLLTWYAAHTMLEDSIPSLSYCIANDTLYFTATGDPTLLYPNFDYAPTYNFLHSSPLPLVYVEKPMQDKRFGPGWSWDDYPYYFSAEKSAFPIYGNMVRFEKSVENATIQVTPSYFENYLTIKQEDIPGAFSLEREEFKNRYRMKFKGDPIEINRDHPFIYSSDLFVSLLTDTLKRKVDRQLAFPACKTRLFYSVPGDSVVKHILIESDNFLAEQMLLLISNQLGDTLSSEKVITSMMENHLSLLDEELHWVDGSGLSRYNQVTPHALVVILDSLYKDIPKQKLYAMLPQPSISGTLQFSFSNLENSIHAKTGSMSHVYNLSGYLETNSGKTLLFSFMNNNFNVSFSELKSEMEKILAIFVEDK